METYEFMEFGKISCKDIANVRIMDAEARAGVVPDIGNFKKRFRLKERKMMEKNFLEWDTKESATFLENIVHQQFHLEMLMELNTKTIGMMAQMLESIKLG